MRLGEYPCILKKEAMHIKYMIENISERHRHRYEFNNDYRERLENAGLHVVGEIS